MGKHGFLGVNISEEYGGGGGGIGDLAAVLEEAAAAGAPMLMMVVSQAICGSVIGRFGTEEQKKRWLPGIADGSYTMAFAITEADAGSNSHNITTTATRDGDEWVLKGSEDLHLRRRRGAAGSWWSGGPPTRRPASSSRACSWCPPTRPGWRSRSSTMTFDAPEKQFTLFFDDVRLPADALVGDEDAGLLQLFAGLNPERIMGAAYSNGMSRFALDKAVEYAKTRTVWKDKPIGSHQGIAHPLAKVKIELEQSKLLQQKAAALYDAGDDMGAGEYANMAKYAAGEVACNSTDVAVHTHGGVGPDHRAGAGQHAGRGPAGPDRPGEPGDDPELRGDALAGAAEVVLSEVAHAGAGPTDPRREPPLLTPRLRASRGAASAVPRARAG